jgi:hypothetical protein
MEDQVRKEQESYELDEEIAELFDEIGEMRAEMEALAAKTGAISEKAWNRVYKKYPELRDKRVHFNRTTRQIEVEEGLGYRELPEGWDIPESSPWWRSIVEKVFSLFTVGRALSRGGPA